MLISKKKQDLKLSQQHKNYVHIGTEIQGKNGKLFKRWDCGYFSHVY